MGQRGIRRYDSQETLFYLPPYWGNEGDYGAVFQPADFGQLADQLAASPDACQSTTRPACGRCPGAAA
jgi:hypothetical protein